MGTFLDTLCIKKAEPRRVVAILREQFPTQRAFVTLRGRHWVNVFLDWRGQVSGGSDLVEIGNAVCSGCDCPGVGFRVVDSDFLYWWVFSQTGTVITQSCREGAFNEPSDDEQVGLGGNLDALAQLFAEAGVTAAKVQHAIELGTPGNLEQTVALLADLLRIQYGNTSYDDLIAAVQRDQTFAYDWTNDWVYVGPGSPLCQTGTTLGNQVNELYMRELVSASSGHPIHGIGPFVDGATDQEVILVVSRADPNVKLSVWRDPGGVTTLLLDPASVRKLIDALQGGEIDGGGTKQR